MTVPYDVIVVGKGNAALCAALSAHENGAKVLVLEAASEEESGGKRKFFGRMPIEASGGGAPRLATPVPPIVRRACLQNVPPVV